MIKNVWHNNKIFKRANFHHNKIMVTMKGAVDIILHVTTLLNRKI